jgi:hypothetical protein
MDFVRQRGPPVWADHFESQSLAVGLRADKVGTSTDGGAEARKPIAGDTARGHKQTVGIVCG